MRKRWPFFFLGVIIKHVSDCPQLYLSHDLHLACPVDQSGNGVRLFLGHNKAKSKFVYKQEVLEYARKHQKSLKAAAEAISDKRGNFMDEILKYSKRYIAARSRVFAVYFTHASECKRSRYNRRVLVLYL